jgi:hypothetical protein
MSIDLQSQIDDKTTTEIQCFDINETVIRISASIHPSDVETLHNIINAFLTDDCKKSKAAIAENNATKKMILAMRKDKAGAEQHPQTIARWGIGMLDKD